jgi:hypothetical protein
MDRENTETRKYKPIREKIKLEKRFSRKDFSKDYAQPNIFLQEQRRRILGEVNHN